MSAQLENNYKYHAPTPEKIQWHEGIRKATKDLAYMYEGLPAGREKALAQTKLEEAMFWANAAIARNNKEE